jgi:hypothetical protein
MARKKQRRRRGEAAAPTGRPVREIDLAEVTRLRVLGLRSLSKIARAMGIPKATMTGAKHGAEVKEAFEDGAAQAEVKLLQQYEDAIKNRHAALTGLLIFKAKQFGWTDRQTVDNTVELGPAVRDRIREAIERLRARGKAATK